MPNVSDPSPPAAGCSFEPPRRGLYRRLFAWVLWRLQDGYGEPVEERKRRMLSQVNGTVVEVGAGAGANLELYPPDAELLLVEPNAYLHGYLHRRAAAVGRSFELRAGTAERMDVPDRTADFVVATLVLCSVDDQQSALGEIHRVLKPGGTFVFLEHVAAPAGSRLRDWQRRLRGFWRLIGDGCTLDRETGRLIEAAGFVDCEIEDFEGQSLSLVRPHIAGTATKA